MDSLFDFKDIKKLIRLANSLDDKGLHKEADAIDQSISSVIGYGKGGRGINKFSQDEKAAAEKALAAAKETQAKAIVAIESSKAAAGAGKAAAIGMGKGAVKATEERARSSYGKQTDFGTSIQEMGEFFLAYDDWRIPADRLTRIAPNVAEVMNGYGHLYDESDFFIRRNSLYVQGSIEFQIPLELPPQQSGKITQEEWARQILNILKDGESGAQYKRGVMSLISTIETAYPAAAQGGAQTPATVTGTPTAEAAPTTTAPEEQPVGQAGAESRRTTYPPPDGFTIRIPGDTRYYYKLVNNNQGYQAWDSRTGQMVRDGAVMTGNLERVLSAAGLTQAASPASTERASETAPPTPSGITIQTLRVGNLTYKVHSMMGPKGRYIGVKDNDPDNTRGLNPREAVRYVFFNTSSNNWQEVNPPWRGLKPGEKEQIDDIYKNLLAQKQAAKREREISTTPPRPRRGPFRRR